MDETPSSIPNLAVKIFIADDTYPYGVGKVAVGLVKQTGKFNCRLQHGNGSLSCHVPSGLAWVVGTERR